MNGRPRRICFVVQRYGREVVGGAERHCRLVAEHLARAYAVTVLTTCAHDYLTWADHYPAGETVEEGVRVIRFPVARRRRVRAFGRLSTRLYRRPHRLSDEVDWMERQGPDVPGLLAHLAARRDEHDLFIFFTYLYATTFLGLPLVADRSLMIPTAHPEEPLAFGIFRYLFPLARGFIFNTPEERDLVFSRFRCGHVPHAVVGVGVDLPPVPVRAPATDASLLYVGRIDMAKGIPELLDAYLAWRAAHPGRSVRLVLAGEEKMRLPRHPDIVRAGFVTDEERTRLLAGATAMVVPSPHESLSMTALEAWAAGVPVLANGRSAVLAGQCARSGGGLAYTDRDGFGRDLDRLLDEPSLGASLGEAGRSWVEREYRWEVVEERLATFIDATWRAIAG